MHRENKEKLDDLVISIDRESEQCFADPQNSFEKKKPLSQKKTLIKRQDPIIKQDNARTGGLKGGNRAVVTGFPDDDKENQQWKANKQSSPVIKKKISAKNNLLKKTHLSLKNKDLEKKKKLLTEKESEVDMKFSNEGLSKKQLDQALFEDYCMLRYLFYTRFGNMEEEAEDLSKISKKTYLGVIELE